jgi:hypothetical protein
MRHHAVSGKSNQDNPELPVMILVEVALAWLILSVFSVVVTAALGRAAARGDSQAPVRIPARLDGLDGIAHAVSIESRPAVRLAGGSQPRLSLLKQLHP